MHGRTKSAIALLTVMAFAMGACSDEPEQTAQPEPTETPPILCPLSGLSIPSGIDGARPAIAIKVENNPSVYPLSGLDKAELVYEEVVEGGVTRFMAFYHCTDANKVGPVRSARVVDPAIMRPITRLLAAAGGNAHVRKALSNGQIITIDEDKAGNAMRRIPRSGIAFEHTLFGNSNALRKVGAKRFDTAPPEDLFEFGEPNASAKPVKRAVITMSSAVTVEYRWNGSKWLRFDDGEPFRAESGTQIGVDNVLVEQHRIDYSKTITDVAGNRSVEIKDEIGSGKAALFRDGRVILGRWVRERVTDPVRFVTRSGEPMTFAEGTIWVALAPDNKGEVKGGFRFRRR